MKFPEKQFPEEELPEINPSKVNFIQEFLYRKPFYRHLYAEASLLMKVMSQVRRDEKARSSSVVRALKPQYPMEGLKIDDVAFVRTHVENRSSDSMLVDDNRGKPEVIDFRLLIDKDFQNEDMLPQGAMVVFKPSHTYLFKNADEVMFKDDNLKPRILRDDLPLEEVERVTNTIDFLCDYTQHELINAGVAERTVNAVFDLKSLRGDS